MKEWIQSGKFSKEHIRKNSMIVNPLTKELSPEIFHEYTVHVGVMSDQDTLV